MNIVRDSPLDIRCTVLSTCWKHIVSLRGSKHVRWYLGEKTAEVLESGADVVDRTSYLWEQPPFHYMSHQLEDDLMPFSNTVHSDSMRLLEVTI